MTAHDKVIKTLAAYAPYCLVQSVSCPQKQCYVPKSGDMSLRAIALPMHCKRNALLCKIITFSALSIYPDKLTLRQPWRQVSRLPVYGHFVYRHFVYRYFVYYDFPC